MHAFAVFNDQYLRPYGCSDTNFTATVNCTNPRTEILSEMIGIYIIEIPIDFLFLCQWQTSLFTVTVIDLVIDCGLHQLF